MRVELSIRLSREAGFTLIELLVASAMMVIITGAAVSVLVSSMHSQSDVTSRADQIGNARTAIERITADIREGESASVPTPDSLEVVKPCETGAGSCAVTYRCGPEAGRPTFGCVREIDGGAATKVVSGLSPQAERDMFCVFPNSEGSECGPQAGAEGLRPRYVGVTVRLPSSSSTEAETVLQDGAALHNSPDLLGNG